MISQITCMLMVAKVEFEVTWERNANHRNWDKSKENTTRNMGTLVS